MSRDALEFNGTVFEMAIASHLQKLFSDSFILQNMELYNRTLNKTSQLDVVLIKSDGIFVIEAKNWKKYIKGNIGEFYWEGFSGMGLMKVISPFNQNFLHVRLLRNFLRKKGVNPPIIHSIICVPDGTQIISNCSNICNFSSLVATIDDCEKIQVNKHLYYKYFKDLVHGR